ncbi:hypothetical protein HQ524_03465 [Candidatus Uhrbacteria bacterium]|nr:hypothetical protein [Candidatus Uhrbacteria bacterium]
MKDSDFSSQSKKDAYFADGAVETIVSTEFGDVHIRQHVNGARGSSYHPYNLSVNQVLTDDVIDVINRASQGEEVLLSIRLYIEPGDYARVHSFTIQGSNITKVGPSVIGWF